jgi:signal transduction histidine kinase
MSCSDDVDVTLRHEVDSLNLLAYRTRYIGLDTTAKYSQMAFEVSMRPDGTLYREGRADALSNLAFVQYMMMDYDSATALYTQSAKLSKNIITQAVADIGLMKICHITARNDEFLDYRHEAEVKLQRLSESLDEMQLSPMQFTFLNYAKSEFHFASATYYNGILHPELADAEIEAITNDMGIVNFDIAQLARYYILQGEYETGRELGMKFNLTYMLASASQHIAKQLIDYPDRINLDTMSDDSIPPYALFIAQDALRLFREYGSLYSRAVTYLTISDYYAKNGMLEVALDTATKALEFVNIQHMGVYGDDIDFLTPYSSRNDVEPTELSWLKRKDISCAWEWIANIRKHLGLLFEQMNMQAAADYNNHIYYTILDNTRQDKRLEHQIEDLEQEKADQTTWAWIVSIFSVLLFVAIFLFIRHQKRATERSYANDINNVEASFNKWMDENEALYNSLSEKEKLIDSETYIHEQHIAENKRSYIDRCTSLSLVYSITPFLDRAINELNKLNTTQETEEVRTERIAYLSELIDRINLYNEVLSHWIKVRQGMVNLNIENFELQPLLDTLSKNHNTFSNKGLTLHVVETDAVVKADKALTLFMMNTLLDNARKYTPEGGEVGIDVQETDNYVEIGVTDTGRGLSKEDIRTICQEKVYDSSQIGDVAHDENLKQNKGFGFGLMNCKGIIDKYKKTNAVFSVCMFNIESQLGKGSRFYFRLPKGVVRAMLVLLMLIPAFKTMSAQSQETVDTAIVSMTLQSKQEQVSQEQAYESLKKDNATRQTFIILALMLVTIAFVVFLVIYYRVHMLPVFNMRQMMQFNKRLFEEDNPDLLELVYTGINDIKAVDGIALGILQNETSQLMIRKSLNCPTPDTVESLTRHSYEMEKEMTVRDGIVRTYLLTVPTTSQEDDMESATDSTVGVLTVVFHNASLSKEDEKIIQLIAEQVAKYVYFSDTKVENQKVELQLKEDEKLRAEKEENTIHIQNMVLDNCLSAIKHETMYYPNRIRQLLDDAQEKQTLPDDEKIAQLSELINYYKDVFSLLSTCAARQLDNVMFKRKTIPVRVLAQYATKSMKRMSKKQDVDIDFVVDTDSQLKVVGDQQMLEYLIDNLISAALANNRQDRQIGLSFDRYDEFVRITFTDEEGMKSEDELSNLFYPEHLRYDEDADRLIGVEYMVCRQIVREHDEYGGRRGCRIIASPCGKGYKMEIMINGS